VHHQLVVQQLAEDGSRDWVVERVDVHTGARSVVARSAERDLVPFAWPDGTILVNDPGRGKVRVVGRGLQWHVPFEGGVLWARVTSRDGHWIGALWSAPGRLPEATVIDARTGRSYPIRLEQGDARVEIIGVLGGAS
jgi:hypothetical protein